MDSCKTHGCSKQELDPQELVSSKAIPIVEKQTTTLRQHFHSPLLYLYTRLVFYVHTPEYFTYMTDQHYGRSGLLSGEDVRSQKGSNFKYMIQFVFMLNVGYSRYSHMTACMFGGLRWKGR